MKNYIVTAILLLSTSTLASDLYCVSEGAAKSRVMMKISRLPGDLEGLLSSLPQLKKDRAPASESGMDEIMTKFFESKIDYTFSVKVGESNFEELIVKALLGGRWENESAIAFMTDPFKPEKTLKFQLATNDYKGALDYKGTHGKIEKHQLNCSREKSAGF